MLGTMYWWYVTAFSSSFWNILTPVDQVLDGHKVQVRMSRLTNCASSGGHPNSIQRRNPGTCCTCCVIKDHWEPPRCNRTHIMCVSRHDTTKHSYSGVVKVSTGERNGSLLSSVMTVGSVCNCMQVMWMYTCTA